MAMLIKKKTVIIWLMVLIFISFFSWRFMRPMNIFNVDDKFAELIDTSLAPAMFKTLRAEECAVCHKTIYEEWKTTIHSQAWTDPYFQVDWEFDDSQYICRHCHTPLDRQMPHIILGYNDSARWDPILADNPDFDPKLQHEGVTCAACHFEEGKIRGVNGGFNTPHPVKNLNSPNEICVRCHVVSGDSWDTFFRFPPCGTVAEIQASKGKPFIVNHSGEIPVQDIADLGCVDCHMPVVERTLIPGGKIRQVRQHLWRGGHDPDMVKKGLTISFRKDNSEQHSNRSFILSIINTGAAHYIPTGTPDRHLTIELQVLDEKNNLLQEKQEKIIRNVLWRPFIIDLSDTRLKPGELREYSIEVVNSEAKFVRAEVRYHLLEESRRKRINYKNKTPINYSVFEEQIKI